MQLNGGINFADNGLKTALKAMHVQTALIGISNENVGGFDKVGYQRKEAVISSFIEHLGVHGISTVTDNSVGRIAETDSPLDLAIDTKGYFQVQSKDGIKMTRDGRFKLDKEGYLLSQENEHVLSNSGTPIKLHIVPEKLSDVVVNDKGMVSVFNKEKTKLENVATLGIVDSNGVGIVNPHIRQKASEFSNVSLQNEFLYMLPMIRNFDANRQMFMIENSTLQKAINQLGSAS